MKTSPSQNKKPLFTRISDVFNEYPRQFWILVGGTFIDRVGGALLFPFFTLYLTRKFEISMTQVGLVFGMFAISSFFGSMIGGALTDRIGRKRVLLFGLVMSALSSVLMGVINDLVIFMIVTLVVGILSDVAGPAQQALVADILPEKQRSQGFGIIRVVANLAVTIGPLIGGLMAARSYLLLFISDAVTSIITAVILYLALKETRHAPEEGEPQESMTQTFTGYFKVFRNSAFVWFMGASILMVLVYMQMNTTLSVFLRDVHGVNEQGFGYILSLNAAMVVLFQFSITRWISKYRPLVIMAIGTLMYAIGFAMYGYVSAFILFLLAMVIITIGEMFVSPVGQSLVARMAPEDMRGRYMAVYGFSWLIPVAVGPLLAGLVMDNLDPNLLWKIAGILGLFAAAAYYFLEFRVGRSRFQVIDQRLLIMERLETGELTAVEASNLLDQVSDGVWAKLASEEEAPTRKHIRIRVSNATDGTMKSDLRVPLGLINAVLHGQASLSTELDGYSQEQLREIIQQTTREKSTKLMKTGVDDIEVSLE